MTEFQIRQGDIFVKAIDKLPDDLTEIERDKGRIVLAYGEVTGHAHAIKSEHATFYKAANDNVYLRVVLPVDLSHEEHDTIPIPAGDYQVIRQREYDDEGEIRIVAD